VNVFERFKRVIKGTDVELDKFGALTVFYYCKIVEMFEEARSVPTDFLRDIAKLVFQEPSPLARFEGYSLANVDLPLKYFAVNLKKAVLGLPRQFECPDGLLMKGPFAYHKSLRGRTMEIHGYLNPVNI
jgi:hypothetical protein